MSWPALWAIIFWGLSFIATKLALREVHPFTLLTLRFGMGGLLLLLVKKIDNVDPTNIILIAITRNYSKI